VPLEDIADVKNGFAFKSQLFNKAEGMPLLRIRDVGRDSTETHYSGQYEPTYIVRTGEIVVGMDGDFRVARWKGPEALLNQRVCKVAVRNRGFYDEDFLLFVLPGYLDAIHDLTSSVTVTHLSSESMKEIPLPLPPLAEQRRIVAAIEEQFSRIDAGVEALHRARRNLQRVRAAILEAALTGRLVQPNPGDEPAEAALRRFLDQDPDIQDGHPPGAWGLDRMAALPSVEPMPRGWVWVNLEMVAITGSGGTPKRDRSEYFGGTIPWVKSGELRDGLVRKTAEFLTDVGLANSSAQLVPRGTLMIALYGATVGKLGILDIEQAATNQAVCTIRPLIPEMRDYLWWVLRHRRNDLIFQGRGGAQPNISQEILKKFAFPLPPMAEQQRIVELVERHWSVLRDVDTAIIANVHRSERLRRAVLSRAFQGRLVPQDPADEPAALLLGRIGVTRAADGSKQYHGSNQYRSRRRSR
jgi:type I restriction enzyme S subunit